MLTASTRWLWYIRLEEAASNLGGELVKGDDGFSASSGDQDSYCSVVLIYNIGSYGSRLPIRGNDIVAFK